MVECKLDHHGAELTEPAEESFVTVTGEETWWNGLGPCEGAEGSGRILDPY